jgi:aspartate/methionine/tyrosine aminotransferase
MRNFISERANGIPPSGIRKFFDLALTMEDVISLGVGEPDFRTPWNICESSIYSIEQGTTSYTPNKGLPALREILSGYLKQHYNLQYNSDDEIIITSGVSEGLDIAIRSLLTQVMKFSLHSQVMSLMLPVSLWQEVFRSLLNVQKQTASNSTRTNFRKRSPERQKRS